MSLQTAAAWQRRMRGFVFSQSFAGSTVRTTLACLAVAAGIAGGHGIAVTHPNATSLRNTPYGDLPHFALRGQLRDYAAATTVAAIVESRCPGQTSAPLRRFLGNGMAGYWKSLPPNAIHPPAAYGGTLSPHELSPPVSPTLLCLGMLLRL